MSIYIHVSPTFLENDLVRKGEGTHIEEDDINCEKRGICTGAPGLAYIMVLSDSLERAIWKGA